VQHFLRVSWCALGGCPSGEFASQFVVDNNKERGGCTEGCYRLLGSLLDPLVCIGILNSFEVLRQRTTTENTNRYGSSQDRFVAAILSSFFLRVEPSIITIHSLAPHLRLYTCVGSTQAFPFLIYNEYVDFVE
jgi:hypothetical protein